MAIINLSYLSVSNFRSIEKIEVDLFDFTSLIGPNNCGKSSIIRAIEIFLNQSKPSIDEWRKGFENEEIIIEGVFDNILDWERDTPGVAGLVNDGKIKLRLRASLKDGKVESFYEAYIKQYEINGFQEKWSENSHTVKQIATSLVIDGTKWRTKANRERVKEEIKQTNPELVTLSEEDWTSENISIAPALKQALPNAVIIPAVKDASDELKPTNTTIFGTLLKQIILPAIQNMNEYRNLMENVELLSKKLSGELEEETPIISQLTNDISNRMSSIIESKIKFAMSTPDTNKFVGNYTTLLMDDGVETTIERQGHGSQRALIFALIEVLANHSSKNTSEEMIRSTILLFEEPELYLHPHLMIRLKNALKYISKQTQWQVLISTHSPFLIDVVENPMSLAILNRKNPSEAPYINQLKQDPFEKGINIESEKNALRASLDFHPTVNQAFFAKRVVLVEGDTEKSLFNHRLRVHEHYEISEEVFNTTTIVSCGGKWTIVPFAKLLKAFKIPFRIVHDCDRKDRTDEELESIRGIDPYKANEQIRIAADGEQIFLVEDTLENLLWEKGTKIPSKDKPFRTWKRINDLMENREELEKFPRLKDLFDFVYKW
ncbi:AAA family ATPase [Bacillus mojavensis]|uniref:AAA family ATPase n=1 Tax=Bacillus mojavensis TaxID=72360 RepID=UPI002DBC4110|nr:AAA family ATPase [Bacillus mojavensis]MEC1733847.1 AAA family ATPase [Bacillus mojavensis]MED1006986.1 AAA family ATPase [Bacillus mojavensis]